MRQVTGIEIEEISRLEILPGFSEDFPHIMSRAEIDSYAGKCAPWHWHNTIELFYMESGEIEYSTPGEKLVFPAGSCGMVNAGMLHMSRSIDQSCAAVQLLHLFDPAVISGCRMGRIWEEYVLPLLASGCDIIRFPNGKITELLRQSFQLKEEENGFELRLRNILSEIWLEILNLLPEQKTSAASAAARDKLKRMMVYVHEHYQERIRVTELAQTAYTSDRECYRLFREYLGCSPVEYIIGYRLQIARKMLSDGWESIECIAKKCGFGTASHFGQIFARDFGCSPRRYRAIWQDAVRNNTEQKER